MTRPRRFANKLRDEICLVRGDQCVHFSYDVVSVPPIAVADAAPE